MSGGLGHCDAGHVVVGRAARVLNSCADVLESGLVEEDVRQSAILKREADGDAAHELVDGVLLDVGRVGREARDAGLDARRVAVLDVEDTGDRVVGQGGDNGDSEGQESFGLSGFAGLAGVALGDGREHVRAGLRLRREAVLREATLSGHRERVVDEVHQLELLFLGGGGVVAVFIFALEGLDREALFAEFGGAVHIVEP